MSILYEYFSTVNLPWSLARNSVARCWNKKKLKPGGRHSSVVSSAPTIMRPRVRICAFSICIFENVLRKGQKRFSHFLKRNLNCTVLSVTAKQSFTVLVLRVNSWASVSVTRFVLHLFERWSEANKRKFADKIKWSNNSLWQFVAVNLHWVPSTGFLSLTYLLF